MSRLENTFNAFSPCCVTEPALTPRNGKVPSEDTNLCISQIEARFALKEARAVTTTRGREGKASDSVFWAVGKTWTAECRAQD